MKKNLFILGTAAMALASCSHSEYDGPDLAGGKLIVTGTVQQINSRASGASWDANDKIGVSSDANHDNILFTTTSGDGVFTTDKSVYVLGDGEKTFTAYYPYTETASNDAPSVKFTDEVDFMWASAKVTRENPVANFVFTHKMTKISITIANDAANASTRADDTTGTITLNGIIATGAYNVITGVVTPDATPGTLNKSFSIGKAIEFIVPAQDLSKSIELGLNYNGKYFTGSISLEKLIDGTQYNYNIDLTEQEEGAPLQISSATITGWEQKTAEDIEVSENEAPTVEEENTLEIGDFLLKDGSVIDKNSANFAKEKDNIVGVVFYVGNPQPSGLYGYNASIDVLKTDYPGCTAGLAIAINDANDGTPARFATAKYSFADVFKESADNYDADLAAQYINTNLNITSTGTRMLGYNDTKFVQVCADKFGDDNTATGVADFLEILKAYNTANTVTGASTWYLPSYAELNAVIENYAVVKASVEKAGGSLNSFSDFGDTNTETFYWTSDFRGNSYNWVSPMMNVAEGVNLYLGRNSNSTKGYFRLTIAF